MKKPYLICSLAIILSLFTNEFLSSQENNRQELEELYNDWRQFEFPPLKNGAPDYSNETFKNRMPEFRKLRDRLIKIDNSELETKSKIDSFDEKFGHLFYTKKKFKNYHLKMDYRFYGEHANQLKNEDEAWNYKNSGVMLHSEDPSKMFLDQEFPVSIEAQFLGGSGERDRPTLNMCSPGTEVDINGSQALRHCVSSSSKTYHNEDWVSVELIVYSDSIVHHVIDKDTVMTYSNIKIGGGYLSDNFTDKIGEPLEEGYISLQSEGHPIEFKNIIIRELIE
mgnify:CR=1 FL=1